MVDHGEYKRWREAGEDAVRGAEAQRQAGLHNWACFMAEQAAQLSIKGLLHAIGAGARGHDPKVLEATLARQLSETPPDGVSAALSRLARHYIPTRYPHCERVRASMTIDSIIRRRQSEQRDLLARAERFAHSTHPLRRLEALEPIPPGVEAIAWTPAEWHAQQARRNPIALEAFTAGIWLVGTADAL